MISSEKRIAANRRNALRSTGPKTEAGKARSCRNALKHGLRGAGFVLPEEDERALRRELADWEAHYEPEGPLARALVRRAALSAVRLERCAREEEARLDERRRHAERRWRLERRKEVESLAARLPIDPCRVAPALRETPEGCSWLMARWRLLRISLEGRGHWTLDEFTQALHLLGRSEQAHRRELSGCRLTAAHLAAQSGRSLDDSGLLSANQGRQWLDKKSRRELRMLRELRESLRADRSRDLASSADLVFFDPRPAASLMRRYETATLSDLNRCVALLSKTTPRGESGPTRPRNRPPVSEPIEPSSPPSPPATPDLPSRPSRSRPKPKPLPDPTPETPPIAIASAPIEPRTPRKARSGLGASIVLAFLLGSASTAAVRATPESVPADRDRDSRRAGPGVASEPSTLPIIAVGTGPRAVEGADRSGDSTAGPILGARPEGESGQDGPGESPKRRQGGSPGS